MIELPSLIPAGTSYVRIPRSKAATMRLILETVQRGSRYWTGGVIPIEKALRLSDKFARLYGTSASQSKRAWDKSQGRSNSMLIMYPEDDRALTPVRWWLLVTPGIGLVFKEEQLLDTWNKRERLTWGEQYELIHLQRGRECGGGRRWTWQMQSTRYEEMQLSMHQFASAHGNKSTDRTDDLTSLLAAIKSMPGFHGIRMQQIELYRLGKTTWNKTHFDPFSGWPGDVPYTDKRQLIYHRPTPLRLDILESIFSAKQAHLRDT